jgi:hypothetical protein
MMWAYFVDGPKVGEAMPIDRSHSRLEVFRPMPAETFELSPIPSTVLYHLVDPIYPTSCVYSLLMPEMTEGQARRIAAAAFGKPGQEQP